MDNEKFMWQEGDLEIEHPIGSGCFIPMREFLRIMEEEEGETGETKDGKAPERY